MKKTLRTKRGFTLIELMITVVVVGIVAAMAVPRFSKAWERQQFRSENRNLISKLRLARSHAISNKQPFGVYVDQDARTITVFQDIVSPSNMTFDDGDSTYVVDTLPHECNFIYTDCDNGVLVFNPNGSASFTGGGNYVLMSATDVSLSYSMLNVLASTGRVQSETNFY
ncbi:MAG: GspH/FimT family pseudopilin [candidate division Zixibacteria bacterium]|nr:GspH/FimT family pseudopilin [candidate division Zixibacteria bacterium]